MLFTVIAKVRRVGAIGVFYDKEFLVGSNSLDDVKKHWYNLYSEQWELFSFSKIQPYSQAEKKKNNFEWCEDVL